MVPDGFFQRVQGEFLEMPGLRLTQPQACRLWGLDRERAGRSCRVSRTPSFSRAHAPARSCRSIGRSTQRARERLTCS